MNLRLAVILCALVALMGTQAAEAGIIVVNYWQFTANGQGYFQEYGAPARTNVPGTNFQDISRIGLSPSATEVQQITDVSTATRTFGTRITGDGTNTLTLSSNLRALLQGQDYSDNGNRQSDGDMLWFTDVVVTETGKYDLFTSFSTRGMSVTSPDGTGYGYYGGGGGVFINDGFTPVYTTGATPNFDVPTPNTTFFSTHAQLDLQAFTTYRIFVGSYMYAGFGGPVLVNYNTGWDVTLRETPAVPEPTSLAIAATGGLLFLGLRRRRS